MPRILLLDDEQNVLSAIKRSLRGGIVPVVRVEDFMEPEPALARLKDASFDVVISDFVCRS